jgi:hypothetical protein
MDAIFDVPPEFGMAIVLVASVASLRMMRGQRWDAAIRSGLRAVLWVSGAILLLGILTWLSADPIASLVVTGIVIAWLVQWSRRRAAFATGVPRCGKGLAPCIAG